jgi:hypothetical protein
MYTKFDDLRYFKTRSQILYSKHTNIISNFAISQYLRKHGLETGTKSWLCEQNYPLYNRRTLISFYRTWESDLVLLFFLTFFWKKG